MAMVQQQLFTAMRILLLLLVATLSLGTNGVQGETMFVIRDTSISSIAATEHDETTSKLTDNDKVNGDKNETDPINVQSKPLHDTLRLNQPVTVAALKRKRQEQPELSPSTEQAPLASPTPQALELASVFSASQASIINQLSAARASQGNRPGSDFVLGLESSILATTDAGNLISKSNAILGISSEQRTPIVTYNLARGRHVGQQSGNGSYWFPARQDLDTLMSKIDSRIVDNFLVVQGPYSSRYGPGFAFYDVELLKAPRYEYGFESHGRTSLDWKDNGDQWYGRQTMQGGSSNWGFRIGYGERSGNDYETGSALEMPTSYNSRDWDIALGWDTTPYQHFDLSILRLDQTDVEFPGQMFDMRYLVTNAYELSYVNDCPCYSDRIESEVWYNHTEFAGDNLAPSKRHQIPGLDGTFTAPPPFNTVNTSLNGFTDVESMSTGYSMSANWECHNCGNFKVGSDMRYLTQSLTEITQNELTPPVFPVFPVVSTIPNTSSVNPGFFVEREIYLNPCTTVRMGGRIDMVHTDSDPTNKRIIENAVGEDLSRDFFLYSSYLTVERRVGNHWTFDAGGGYAMRPPTMTELYADDPYIAAIPQVVVQRIIGNPNLDASRLWQVDLGVDVDICRFRGGARGYHAWIHDYITYDFINILPPAGGHGYSYNTVNTPLATLWGGEAYAEYDVHRCWTGFSTLSYINGQDHTRNETIGVVRQNIAPGTTRSDSLRNAESLAVIAPLQCRAGLRWHDPCPQQRWAAEFVARIVDNQDRVAGTLVEFPTPGFTIYDIRTYLQATQNLVITAGVDNLFDRFYQEHFDPRATVSTLGVFQPGRTFYTGFDWKY